MAALACEYRRESRRNKSRADALSCRAGAKASRLFFSFLFLVFFGGGVIAHEKTIVYPDRLGTNAHGEWVESSSSFSQTADYGGLRLRKRAEWLRGDQACEKRRGAENAFFEPFLAENR